MDVKSLLVKIGTDTSGMEAGFKKADGLIASNAEKFKKAGRAMTVAGGAIVGSLGLMVKSYVTAGDEVHKMGLRTGFSTEALSELKYAAEISGTSIGSLEKGIKKMASSIGEAKLGLKTYTDAFALIGMEVEELDGLNPEEQFMKMAAGIAEIEDPTQRAYAAQKLLGRAGTELLPLFAEGAEGMEALRQKARDMGLSISGPAAGGAAALNDAMTDLKGSFKGVSMAIAEQLAPIIKGLVEKITNAVVKVKDWIKENPVLAGVLMKVVGAVGILLTVLGPILIMLPALAGGFTMLWGAITGPVGIVLGAIALVAGAAFLIYKNWEPIKEFFIGLWEDVSGFFVNAFNSIKAKLLEWAIKIADILAKIPIAKKLAGPWKEALQGMQADMADTAAATAAAAAQITGDSVAIGQAFFEAIKGTTLFKDAVEAVKGETGLLDKVLAGAKVGLKALSVGFGTAGKGAVDAGEKIAEANKKITDLTKTMVNEIKKATLDDYTYSKEMLDQKLADRITAIGDEEAAEGEKNKALATARASHYAEMKALDEGAATEQAEKQKALTETVKQIWIDYWAAVKAKHEEYEADVKEKLAEHLAEQETLVSSINQLEMGRYQYASWLLDQKYAKEKETSTNLLLLTEEYFAQKKALADAAREEEDAARKQSLENTLADISMTLSAIGGLFQMSYQNNMIRIDNEEKRRMEAIDNQYNAQIEALTAIEEAEKKKTKEVLDAVNREYDDKKQHILDNMEDNEERDLALAELEQTREDRLTQARINREIAEDEAAQAVIDIEEAKNEAIRIASEDLEAKRAAARRTAAKQEKAVALLSAIVNTAAAVTKALPNIPLAIAVGVLGAVQIALISSKPIPLAEGGVVTRRTEAVIGEAGPEAVIPLNKIGGGLGLAPVYVKQTNYFYGDINNAGDIDEISDRLARRMTRQLERGRRS